MDGISGMVGDSMISQPTAMLLTYVTADMCDGDMILEISRGSRSMLWISSVVGGGRLVTLHVRRRRGLAANDASR